MGAFHLCKHTLFHACLKNSDRIVFFDKPAVSLMLWHERFKMSFSMVFLVFIVLIWKSFKIILTSLQSAKLLKANERFSHWRYKKIFTELAASWWIPAPGVTSPMLASRRSAHGIFLLGSFAWSRASALLCRIIWLLARLTFSSPLGRPTMVRLLSWRTLTEAFTIFILVIALAATLPRSSWIRASPASVAFTSP